MSNWNLLMQIISYSIHNITVKKSGVNIGFHLRAFKLCSPEYLYDKNTFKINLRSYYILIISYLTRNRKLVNFSK